MKIADLIPIILRELSTGDKYGYEIIKNIETKTDNRLQIKQPALYTVLKKLEASKFISSYWEDSTIGGKRHYYKITTNGMQQLETFPPYEILVSQILKPAKTSTAPQKTEVEKIKETPSIDQKTSHQLNIENIDIQNDVKQSGKEIETFTTVAPVNTDEGYKQDLKEIFDSNTVPQKKKAKPKKVVCDTILPSALDKNNLKTNADYIFPEIKSYDYVDFMTDKKTLTSKSINHALLYKNLATCMLIFLEIIILYAVSRWLGHNKYFDIIILIVALAAIGYFCYSIISYNKNKFKYLDIPLNYNIKKDLIIRSVIFAVLLITILILNLTKVTLVGENLFSPVNFVNFYALIILSSNLYIDYLFKLIFLKKYL